MGEVLTLEGALTKAQTAAKTARGESGMVSTKAQGLAEALNAVAVVDKESHVLINERISLAKGLIKHITEICALTIEHAHKAHKAAIKVRDDMLNAIQLAVKKAEARDGVWFLAERRRLEAEERERIRKREEEAALERALEIEDAHSAGDVQAAAELSAAPIEASVDTAPVREMERSVGGQTLLSDWDFSIEEPNDVPREFCVPDESKIRKIVKAMKGETCIKGVRVFERTVHRGRA